VQDRYIGDVGQFLKAGLLRWLVSPSPYGHGYRLGVIWFQEPGGLQRIDGDHLAYLHSTQDADEALRSLDPDLYDRLRLMAAQSGRPVSVRETYGALPTDTVRFDRPLEFDDKSRDDPAARLVARQRWFHEAMVAVSPCSLVFLDADDDLAYDDAMQSSPTPSEAAGEHVSLSEIGKLIDRGQSVVMHQLTDASIALAELANGHLRAIHDALGVEPLAMARESNGRVRLITIIPSRGHQPDLHARVGALQLSRWGDEFRVYRWNSALVRA
jgi:hypothetical protein